MTRRMKLFSKAWWEAANERAAKTAAQGFLLGVGPTVTSWMGADWKLLVYLTIGGALTSYATSITVPPAYPGKSVQ